MTDQPITQADKDAATLIINAHLTGQGSPNQIAANHRAAPSAELVKATRAALQGHDAMREASGEQSEDEDTLEDIAARQCISLADKLNSLGEAKLAHNLAVCAVRIRHQALKELRRGEHKKEAQEDFVRDQEAQIMPDGMP